MAEPLTGDDWQHFLHRYETFVNDRTRLRLEGFKTRFASMKTALQAFNTLLCEINKYRARDFNLFRLLGVERYEVTTHSVVLADLLNPQGMHGQHCLFLRTFLHHCVEKFRGTFPRPHGDMETAAWFVDREKVTALGVLDLVIACPDLQFMLVIKNKIDAGEQQDQLRRYAQWMNSQRGYFAERVLMYLTPGGISSNTAMQDPYFTLSYHCDIFKWLCVSLLEVKSVRVKETVGQYIDVIRSI